MKKSKYEISLWEDYVVPQSYKETEDETLKEDKKYYYFNEDEQVYSSSILGSLIKLYQSFPNNWFQKEKDSLGNETGYYIEATDNLSDIENYYYLNDKGEYIQVAGKTISLYKTCIWYETNVPEHYEERKICNIGSDSMTAQWRAREPKMVENINGTNTFTFKMFYTYVDTEDGIKKANPFLVQLVNERKVKVKWKNKWYDLFIKSQQEDSNGKSITYTCKDQFINELSKTGFELEFSNELMNNQGTIQELGERVVEGTDWKIDVENSSIIKQKKEEPVYEVLALNDFTSEENINIKINEKFYIFYSVFNNQEKEFFQFWYDETQTFSKQNKTSMLLTSGECLSLKNVDWVSVTIDRGNILVDGWEVRINEVPICQISKTAQVSNDYRAERLVRSQKSSFDAVVDQSVLHYGINGLTDDQNLIYSYYKTEYPDVLMVQNLITNPSNFNYKDSGWNTIGGIVHNAYPLVDDLENDNPSISYIEIKPNQLLYNSGIMNHISAIGDSETGTGFTQGDEFIFRYKAKTVNSGNPGTTYENQGDLVPSFYRKLLNTDTNAYEPTGETSFEVTKLSQNARWNEYKVKCIKSISYEDLGSWGIFLKNEGSNKRFLQEAQFFKYYLGEPIIQDYDEKSSYYEDTVVLYNSTYYQCIRDAKPGMINNSTYWKNIGAAPNEDLKVRINPGSYSTQSYAVSTQVFYAANQKIEEAAELEYMFKGTEDEVKTWLNKNNIIPIYTDNYEKIRSIEAKQSNRFNILQSLAETFQSYIRFYIEHDEATGKLIYDLKGVPNKTITFVEEVGKEIGYGFVYGIDLKTISRTVTSDNIASKVIVSKNNNQYAKNGFCTIARASENYPRTEFILNFDYYITQGLLNKEQVNKDLYSSVEDVGIGYYFNLNKLNTQYDSITENLEPKNNELLKQKALLISYKGENGGGGLIHATNQEINETKSELSTLAGLSTWNETTIKQYKDSHPDYTKFNNLYISYISLKSALKQYKAQAENLQKSVDNLESIVSTLKKKQDNPDWEKNNESPGIVQLKKELDKKFFYKYSRFIQEGTWTSEEYIDDNLYYLDAQSVAYTSSRPQIQYNISVLRLSALEEFKGKEFRLGDISFIEDTEFFGYVPDKLPKTPYREKVLISEITSVFESPESDSFKVQNYKTQFEDLFQRITATTKSLQYAQGEYARAAGSFTPTGEINVKTLQQSFDMNAELAWAATDDSVVIDNTGITVVDTSNPNQIVRLSSEGLQFSNNGGQNFFTGLNGNGISTKYLTSGMINTADITIGNADSPTFKWDIYGINALAFTLNDEGEIISRDTTKFVRFDRFGLYGMTGSTIESWIPKDENEVWENAPFSLTWKGFRLKNSYGDGYVSIDSIDDFVVVDSEGIKRIKIGNLADKTAESPVYGLTINNEKGSPILIAENGQLWLKDKLEVQTYNQANSVQIGKLDTATSKHETHGGRVIDAHGQFVVYEDGHLKATGADIQVKITAEEGSFKGHIEATSGKIGNMSIAAVEESTYRVVIESSNGTSLKTGGAHTTLTAKLYQGATEITSGIAYKWSTGEITQQIEVEESDFNTSVLNYTCEITLTEENV